VSKRVNCVKTAEAERERERERERRVASYTCDDSEDSSDVITTYMYVYV